MKVEFTRNNGRAAINLGEINVKVMLFYSEMRVGILSIKLTVNQTWIFIQIRQRLSEPSTSQIYKYDGSESRCRTCI